MLGWWITITNEEEKILASWEVSVGGLNWIDELIESGDAEGLNELQGYPNKYKVSREKALEFLHKASFRMELLGNGYQILQFNGPCINKCLVSDNSIPLYVEAWDLS